MVHGRLVEKPRSRIVTGSGLGTDGSCLPLLISRMTRDTRTRHCLLDISDSKVKLAIG